MRDFKEPYYTGPECVCCSSKPANEKTTKTYARGASDGRKNTLDIVLAVLRQERLEWGFGTLAAKMIDGLIIRIEEKFETH